MISNSISTLYHDHFDTLRERYDRALENHQFDQLLIYSGALKMQFLDDIPYPFHTNPQFKALVPLVDAPESWIVWRPTEKPVVLIYQPDDFWHTVPELPDQEWVKYFDVKIIGKPEHAKDYFGNLGNTAFIGETSHSPDRANCGQYLSAYQDKPNPHDWALGKRNPPTLYAELNWSRNIKTSYEQYCIREANQISARGHHAARDAFYNGGSELEIALAFQTGCQQNENELAYPSIVGINQNAAILHKQGYDKTRIAKSQLKSMLIDAGAQYSGYCSDITRTYAYRDGLFAQMISVFDRDQQTIASNIKPGQNYANATLDSLLSIANLLKEVGVIDLEPEAAFDTGIIHAFMPHRLGHFIGSQVHDVGGDMKDSSGAIYLPDKRFPRPPLTRPFERGQIITVEPGLYFIELLLTPLREGPYSHNVDWGLVDKLMPYGGMRIEDDVLILDSGAENLTRKGFDEIYAMPAE